MERKQYFFFKNSPLESALLGFETESKCKLLQHGINNAQYFQLLRYMLHGCNLHAILQHRVVIPYIFVILLQQTSFEL